MRDVQWLCGGGFGDRVGGGCEFGLEFGFEHVEQRVLVQVGEEIVLVVCREQVVHLGSELPCECLVGDVEEEGSGGDGGTDTLDEGIPMWESGGLVWCGLQDFSDVWHVVARCVGVL